MAPKPAPSQAPRPDLPDDGLPRFLSPKTAARLLELSTTTLANWRRRGQGPPFIRLYGSYIRYPLAGLLQFLDNLVLPPRPSNLALFRKKAPLINP